jgi:hypothetical protein
MTVSLPEEVPIAAGCSRSLLMTARAAIAPVTAAAASLPAIRPLMGTDRSSSALVLPALLAAAKAGVNEWTQFTSAPSQFERGELPWGERMNPRKQPR